MEKENSLSPTLMFMMETGKMVKCMEVEPTNQMVQESRENGNMET